MLRRFWERLTGWICERIGICLRFDGDLMAPSGDEPWWREVQR